MKIVQESPRLQKPTPPVKIVNSKTNSMLSQQSNRRSNKDEEVLEEDYGRNKSCVFDQYFPSNTEDEDLINNNISIKVEVNGKPPGFL
jgi:hypothetical protein